MTTDKGKLDSGQQALGEALAVSFRVLRWMLGMLLILYLSSGFFIVQQHQKALVLVFGRVAGLGADRLKEPGLHWTFPPPVAEVVRVPAERVQTLETSSFWPKAGALDQPAGPDTEPAAPTLKPGADGYTLTGDANLLHSRWAIRYTISDPETYLFRHAAIPAVLRAELDHAVIQASAGLPVDQALRTQVEAFRAAVENELRRRCEALFLGLRLQGLDVLALMPPRQVAAAFNAVVEAENERSTRISEARAYAARRTNEARGQAAQLRAEGATQKSRLLSQVSADADYFDKVLVEYAKNPDLILRTLRQDAVRRALAQVEQKFVVYRGADGQQEVRLQISPEQAKKK
ncbi:MAG: protease modulator HflK [Kiritimatiellaeota bacterium]|nr:protease modulator HflK [Kiritimatiellota bacterium]